MDVDDEPQTTDMEGMEEDADRAGGAGMPLGAIDERWKDILRAAFETSLAEMDPEQGEAAAEAMLAAGSVNSDDVDENDLPDLYSFYEELVALRSEHRTGNRKMASAFKQFAEVLETQQRRLTEMQQSAPERPAPASTEAEATGVPDRFGMGLATVYDRVGRIRLSFSSPPKAPLFGGAAWLKAWKSMDEAVGMLHAHLEELLAEAGMERITTENAVFDPTLMRAVAVRTKAHGRPANSVFREIASGWLKNGRVISPAEVEICKTP